MEEPVSFAPLTKEIIRRSDLGFEWSALEYHHHERGGNWYWAVGMAAIVFAIGSILFGNFLLALIVVIGAFTSMMYASRPPETINITVSQKGVRVQNYLYPMANIKSFCLQEHNNRQLLLLDIDKMILPVTTIPIDNSAINLEQLRQYLEVFIPEIERPVPLVEMLAEHLGF